MQRKITGHMHVECPRTGILSTVPIYEDTHESRVEDKLDALILAVGKLTEATEQVAKAVRGTDVKFKGGLI